MINDVVARKVLETVDAGLVQGIGEPVPGQMCVEAAVCYAMGLPHGDDPGCVAPALRSLKIVLNDANWWSSSAARAAGLRRLALAQLGSAGVLDEAEFARRVAEMTVRKVVPAALRATGNPDLEPFAVRCEQEGTVGVAEAARAAAWATGAAQAAWAAAEATAVAEAAQAAQAAREASWAASWAAAQAAWAAEEAARIARAAARAAAWAAALLGDQVLIDFAEAVVQILIDMNAPGCQWLTLTEVV